MNEEKEVKKILKENKKNNIIEKILESHKTEIIINRIEDLSDSIKNLIVTKLQLNNEEKEGKLFIILFALILFIVISIITIILLTSLVGIHLIFLLVKYSIILLYKIIKNKKYEIKKYLSHKFPKTILFTEKQEYITNNTFSDIIFKEVEQLIIKMDKLNLSNEEKASIAIRLKEIVLLVKKEDGTIKQELYNLEIKQKIAFCLSEIDNFLNEYKNKEQDNFNITKNNILENIDNYLKESPKVYQKIKN